MGQDLLRHGGRYGALQGVQQQIISLLQLIVQSLDAEQQSNPGPQLHLVEGLADEVVRPRFNSLHAVAHVGQSGDQNDRHEAGRGVGPHTSAYGKSGHPRHLYVEDDQVYAPRTQNGQSLFAPTRPC